MLIRWLQVQGKGAAFEFVFAFFHVLCVCVYVVNKICVCWTMTDLLIFI